MTLGNTQIEKVKWEELEGCFNSVKGAFTPEQFGVFLNMYSWEVEDNYLVAFHENFHHWQSVFTPYGHLKWRFERDMSSRVIELWLAATERDPSSRPLPAAYIIPCKDLDRVNNVAKILLLETSKQILSLSERVCNDQWLQQNLPISLADICPTISLFDQAYQMNGIDILESFAKFQEAALASLVEGKHFHETIDPRRLRPEYYSALYYFMSHVGADRIIEFPVACELALSSSDPCVFDDTDKWKMHHPAWRFIKIIDTISKYDYTEYLTYNNVKGSFLAYTEKTLQLCGFKSWRENWKYAKEYVERDDLSISKNMREAIEFKQQYPWALSFPLNDDVLLQMKKFHPYYYIMSDTCSYTVDSWSLGSEVMFENHYQAFSNQICGHMSQRCLDRSKIQCGYSYYGIKKCQHLIDGACNGHVDCNSWLPPLVIDENSGAISGCDFEAFLKLLKVNIRDLAITDISKKIDPDSLIENMKMLQT